MFSIINTSFAKAIIEVDIYIIDYSVNISGIELLYLPTEYTVFYIYFLSIIDNSNRYRFAKIRVRTYVIDIIKSNLLIDIDIIDCKSIVADSDSDYTIIYLYKNFIFAINYKSKINYTVSISIYIIRQIIIFIIFSVTILVKIKLNLSDQNLIFESIDSTIILQLIYYVYLVNASFLYIKVANNILDSIVIFRHACFGTISDSDYITVYRINKSIAELTCLFVKLLIKKSTDSLVINKKIQNKTKYSTENSLINNRDIDKNKTTVTLLGITIYSKNLNIV